MKPVHDKVDKEEFVIGNTYNISLRGKPLYAAEVVKFHGGCWVYFKIDNIMLRSKSPFETQK